MSPCPECIDFTLKEIAQMFPMSNGTPVKIFPIIPGFNW
jgi:hypothetical protein